MRGAGREYRRRSERLDHAGDDDGDDGDSALSFSDSSFKPLSFSQERLWFLHQVDPASTAYNVSTSYRFHGPLDVDAFAAAFTEVTRRHEMLRARPVVTPEGPGQVIDPVSDQLVRVDLAQVPAPARLEEVRRMAARDAMTPFDLKSPPLRTSLVRLGERDHVWLLTLHHLICDGWSLDILWRELAALYDAFTTGCTSPLTGPRTSPLTDPLAHPPSLRFTAHARREREAVESGALDGQFDYWREALADVPPLALPTDHPYPPLASSRGARVELKLPAPLTADIRRIGLEQRVTPFMLHLAAFQVLLARYCRQSDIAVGLPVAGRTRTDVEQLIGCFVNTVVLRGKILGSRTFREVLVAARGTVLDAMDHQELPFESLVAGLRPRRDPARPPLFQAMISVENPPTVPELPGLRVERLPVRRDTAQFELTLTLRGSGDAMALTFEYATDLFDHATIDRLAHHYRTLLESVVADPDQRVDGLALLTPDAREQVLVRGRGPRPVPPAADRLHAMVLRQAARNPTATAVEHGDTRLTYAELTTAATRLGARLRGIGVTPGAPVGLYAERGPELILGMLAILGAGAACLPLRPGQPATRVAALLADAGAEYVLTGPGTKILGEVGADEAAPGPNAAAPPFPHLIPINRHELLRADSTNSPNSTDVPPKHPPTPPDHPTPDAAFVLHTSGSTGTPKPVELTHTGLVPLFTHMVSTHGITPEDRVLSFSSIGADMCVEEIFLALCGGATVVVSDDIVDTAPRFFATCTRLGLTVLNLPTAYWHELSGSASAGSARLPDTVRLVLIGGDRALPAHLRRWFSPDGPRTPLVNAYGPTETTINAVQHRFTDDRDLTTGREAPIGRPLPGVSVYVLDDSLRPQPVGVPGELYIGGTGVARGYLGQPARTAERFLSDPYAPEAGARMYRTGDLVRWRADGLLEYLGRVDDQVKIRGFRVEPGEITAHLRQHPDIGDAAVLVHGDSAGDRRLVGYVAPVPGRPCPDGDALRAFLARTLPDYMVPAAWVPLERLPRTGNGKVDRRALPAPRTTHDHADAAPRTPLERLLAELWSDVLQTSAVSIDANFFDLGGHSLQTVQLAGRISAALGTDVPVKLILRHPTVAALAEAITALLAATPPARDVVPGVRAAPKRTGKGADNSVRDEDPDLVRDEDPDLLRHEGDDFVRFDARPLHALIASGELPPVDAATLSCVPESLLLRRGMGRDEYIGDWCQGVPMVSGIKETRLGRIALMTLPFPEADAYRDPAGLVRAVVPGLRTARQIGARAVSLINLLPSATDYGRSIVEAVRGRTDVPVITTGHGTTIAAIVLNTEQLLRRAGREMSEESVAFVGLGSIGVSALRLHLRRLPPPRRITLCDLYSRRSHLEEIRTAIRSDYDGPVDIAEATDGSVPDAVYAASLIVAATNVPDVIDVSRLPPGCLVIDDSAPHCFDPDRAWERMRGAGDLLCVEGGELHSPETVNELRYVPPWVRRRTEPATLRGWFEQDPFAIGGCVLSSLLTAVFEEIPGTVGVADLAAGERNHALLARLGFTATRAQLEDTTLTGDLLGRFRERHGAGSGHRNSGHRNSGRRRGD
ncbi:amino acid adenylation domain-containing protein [Streptomyces sp. NPDC091292]|uniref:non-ribosomal peptide synthetase n=1 Tax=Streptomyces sp. NPDC091292 TaxID=3365991 RepID=UPI0037F823CD